MAVLESLLSIPQAAKLAAISPSMMRKLIASERAPRIVRVGRSVRIRAADFDRWIKLGCCSRDQLDRVEVSGR